MAIYLTDIPFTANGESLSLTPEQEESLKTVYKKNKDGDLCYHSDYNPDSEYDDEHYILPFRSTFDGFVPLRIGTEFANVSGSTGDICSDSWHKLFAINGHAAEWNCRAEANKIYEPARNPASTVIQCTSNSRVAGEAESGMAGGHVTLGRANRTVKTNDLADGIYIIPICTAHNIKHLHGKLTGTGYYMKLAADTHAIKLKGQIRVKG